MGERKRLTRAQRGAYLRRPGAGRAVPRVAGRSQVASVCDRVTSLGAAFHVQSGDGTRAERDALSRRRRGGKRGRSRARGSRPHEHTACLLSRLSSSPPWTCGVVPITMCDGRASDAARATPGLAPSDDGVSFRARRYFPNSNNTQVVIVNREGNDWMELTITTIPHGTDMATWAMALTARWAVWRGGSAPLRHRTRTCT